MRKTTNLILRMQPYPKELKEFCRLDPEFKTALKSIHPEKFISLSAVITSYCPLVPEDQIIGFLVYDYGKMSKFKQDFIVNVGSKNKEFIIYTRFKGIKKNKYIRDINDFYQKYPTYDKKSHHPLFEEIPDILKPRALTAIKLSERIKKLGLIKEVTDQEYERMDLELQNYGL